MKAAMKSDIHLRPLQPGDIGWVISRHGSLYATEYGLDITFEITVAEIAAQIMRGWDPTSDNAWIAERGGLPVGSIFIVRADATTAKLRLLIIDPSARGLGLGRQLADAAIGFARTADYHRITLWTMGMLDAARHIYATAGFTLTDSVQAHEYGRDLVNETWQLDLTP